MPELPEVETIRRTLVNEVKGLSITGVTIDNYHTLDKISVEDFKAGVTGAVIIDISRRGKYFIFELNSGKMVLHLRMNGELYVSDASRVVSGYSLIRFTLSNNMVLTFSDMRKFAKAYFIPIGVEDTVSGVSALGLEPFDKELNAKYLKKYMGYLATPVKTAIMDQHIIAGYGNLYSDELLFVCGINPKKRCMSLTDENYETLARNIPIVMEWGLMLHEGSGNNFQKVYGRESDTKKNCNVYGRTQMRCNVCDNRIMETKLGGRTAHYCPYCQSVTKIRIYDITPDKLADVAIVVGTCIKLYGLDKFDVVLKEIVGEHTTSFILWEKFVDRVWLWVNTEQSVGLNQDSSWARRGFRSNVLAHMDQSNFDEGIRWIKSQKWRNSN